MRIPRSGVRGRGVAEGVAVGPRHGIADAHGDGRGCERWVLDIHRARGGKRDQRQRKQPTRDHESRRPRDRGAPHRHTLRPVPSQTADAPFAALARDAERIGVHLDAATLALCARFSDLVIERNTTMNLTAITAPADIATKHFLDSFTAVGVRKWTGHERVVDVGSGAGFPGLALRLALPGIRVTLVESMGKKARFLEEVTSTLAIDGVEVRTERAEALVPSIDVRGQRLSDGPVASVLERVRKLVAEGAEELHLVDLDAAEGASRNLELMAEIARAAKVPCRLAGGVSRVDEAQRAIERGFAGILFSSAVFGDDELLKKIASLGHRAIVEIEARAGFLAPRGGDADLVAVATGRGALAAARAAQIGGVRALYLIDLTLEGHLAGPPLALVDAVRAVVGQRVALHAGGGVRDLDDVRALASRGVASVVIGRALAERRFTIRAAREVAA